MCTLLFDSILRLQRPHNLPVSDKSSRKDSRTYLNIYLAESIPPIVTDEQQTRFGDPNHAHCLQIYHYTYIYVQEIILYRVTPVPFQMFIPTRLNGMKQLFYFTISESVVKVCSLAYTGPTSTISSSNTFIAHYDCPLQSL